MDHKKSTGKMAKAIKRSLCQTGPSADSPICGKCHMATETAPHNLCECVVLAQFKYRRLDKHFYGTKRL
jgi:hypothetical protein